LPLEQELQESPEVKSHAEGATLAQRNPRHVIAHNVEYGDEVWPSFEGAQIAVGRFKAGELQSVARSINQTA